MTLRLRDRLWNLRAAWRHQRYRWRRWRIQRRTPSEPSGPRRRPGHDPDTRPQPLASQDAALWEWLQASGIAVDTDLTQRVVIDITIGEVVTAYTQKMVDTRLLTAGVDLEGVHVRAVDPPEPERRWWQRRRDDDR